MVNDKSKQYKQQNSWIKENCTRIGGTFPKDFAQEFKDDCKVIVQILRAIMVVSKESSLRALFLRGTVEPPYFF